MYTKKKKIVITVAVIVLIIFSMIYFSVDAKRLGEISGYYTGVDLKKDGRPVMMTMTVTFFSITVVMIL